MKKTDINKAKIVMLGYGAALAAATVLPAHAGSVTCTPGTPTTAMTCTIPAANFSGITADVNYTGSNEVNAHETDDGVSQLGVCAYHNRGTSSYGLTLNGGSMQVFSGTASSPTKKTTANYSGAPCS